MLKGSSQSYPLLNLTCNMKHMKDNIFSLHLHNIFKSTTQNKAYIA